MPDLPPRVTTPLLTLITAQSMDEDYSLVAARRAEAERAGDGRGPGPSRGGRRHLAAAVLVAVFGVLVATAAVQTSRNADVDDASRNTLVARITDQREAVSRLQDRIVELREGNGDLQTELARITASQQRVATTLRRLQVRTGFVAVTGPGVRVVVDDGPGGDLASAVQDKDLRLLVDGLWNAGAEAVAINGQRLTVLSAIRNSNAAIHVNSVPLTPPYAVSAIGDPRSLQADLVDSTAGAAFVEVANQLGFDWTMDNVDALRLPAAPPRLLRLRAAQAAGPDTDDEGRPAK